VQPHFRQTSCKYAEIKHFILGASQRSLEDGLRIPFAVFSSNESTLKIFLLQNLSIEELGDKIDICIRRIQSLNSF
jgi:hypothetical protein